MSNDKIINTTIRGYYRVLDKSIVNQYIRDHFKAVNKKEESELRGPTFDFVIYDEL